MKKIIALVLSALLLIGAAVVGTVAFLTDTDQDVNVMTVGNVKIEQLEYERVDVEKTGDVALQEFTQAKPIDPAVYEDDNAWANYAEITWKDLGNADAKATVWANITNEQDKFVFIKNTGLNEAYLRTWIAYELGELELDDWKSLFHINANTTDWTWSDASRVTIGGVNYAVVSATYNTALAAGTISAPSLLQYAMDEEVTNDTVASFGATYDILVYSQAVQTIGFDNAEKALLKAFGSDIPWTDNAGIVKESLVNDSLENAMQNLANAIDPVVYLNLSGNISWTTGAGIGSTPVVSEGSKIEELYLQGTSPAETKLTVGGSGVGAIRSANGGKLIFSNMTIVDESVSYAETNWEYGYLEFAGDLVFVNCVFDGAIMLEGENATFINCKFTSAKESEYAVWVSNGNATFKNCTFTPYRGLKLHEAYGSEIGRVIVDSCTFGPLSEKPGIAIGDLNADTSVSVINNNFNGCQAGDQGLYIYETDTDVTTFSFYTFNNAIDVKVSNVLELDKALADGYDVVLKDDMSFSADDTTSDSGYGATGVTVTGGSVLDGNGNTISVEDANGTWDCAINANAGTIKNLTVNDSFRGIFMASASGDVYIDNVIIDKVCYTFNSDGGSKNYGVYISNSTLNGWTSYSDVHKEVVFTNCKFGQGTGGYQYAFCRPYNESVFENCVFEEGFEFDTSKTSDITFINCYYGDTLITAENAATLSDGTTTFFYNGLNGITIQ